MDPFVLPRSLLTINRSVNAHSTLTRARLAWIQQSYIRADTITAANNRLVDVHAAFPMTKALGTAGSRRAGGELASADGIRFVVPVRSVHAGANPKYLGRGKEVTYVNYTSAGSIGFFGFVVPGHIARLDGHPGRGCSSHRLGVDGVGLTTLTPELAIWTVHLDDGVARRPEGGA